MAKYVMDGSQKSRSGSVSDVLAAEDFNPIMRSEGQGPANEGRHGGEPERRRRRGVSRPTERCTYRCRLLSKVLTRNKRTAYYWSVCMWALVQRRSPYLNWRFSQRAGESDIQFSLSTWLCMRCQIQAAIRILIMWSVKLWSVTVLTVDTAVYVGASAKVALSEHSCY